MALVAAAPEGARSAPARALDGSAPDKVLAAWTRASKPVRAALRADARLIEADGEEALVSLVLMPPGRRLAFDDPAVAQARRAVLAGLPADGLCTLMADATSFAGAITVRRGPGAERLLREDPFARLAPARLLYVGPGLLGRVAPTAGPTIERYGSDQPWPRDRFA